MEPVQFPKIVILVSLNKLIERDSIAAAHSRVERTEQREICFYDEGLVCREEGGRAWVVDLDYIIRSDRTNHTILKLRLCAFSLGLARLIK